MKRLCDIAGSAALLVLLGPLLVALWLLVRLKLGGPAIFQQERPGMNGHIFTLKKFRSMTDECGADGELLPDDVRLPPFGRWLRRTSLDELPELINILRGEMSFVGPRPLLVEYLDYYTPEQARRHEVRPGLTGWAQVRGRNSITWPEKFRLDTWYVDNHSLFLDSKILVLTAFSLLEGKDVEAQGCVTMPKFKPSDNETR